MRAASRTRTLMWIGTLLVASAPALADESASPSASPAVVAPVVEKVIARHEGFELTVALKTADGNRFRQGTYDVSVIQAGDDYFLQLIHRTTRRGIRLPATFRGRAAARMVTSEDSQMRVRSEATRGVFTFETETFVVESVLGYG